MAQQYEVTEFVGIDISKATFDIHGHEIGEEELINDKNGYKRLLGQLDEGSCCVMEATAGYHHKLAKFLYVAYRYVGTGGIRVFKLDVATGAELGSVT